MWGICPGKGGNFGIVECRLGRVVCCTGIVRHIDSNICKIYSKLNNFGFENVQEILIPVVVFIVVDGL